MTAGRIDCCIRVGIEMAGQVFGEMVEVGPGGESWPWPSLEHSYYDAGFLIQFACTHFR